MSRRTGADWAAPDADAIRRILDLVRAARVTDGVEALSGHVLDALATTSALQIVEADDLLGVAVISGDDPAELLVHPDHRGRGIGGRLLDATLARHPRVWAHGDLPAARALAAARDLAAVRMLLQLRRSLAGLPPQPALPDGVRIRTFDPAADVVQFLGVNARAFAWHPEQGRLDDAGMRHEMAQPWFDPAGFFLVVTDEGRDEAGGSDRVLGFHWTKIHEVDPIPVRPGSDEQAGPSGPVGEVYVIAVDPLSPVRRLGEPLTLAGLHHLAGRGQQRVMLYVEGDNPAALALYRRLGFGEWATDVVYADERS